MNTILQRIKRNRLFLLFILLFAYAQSVQSRIWVRQELNIYIFTPEAAVATLVSACFLFLIINFFIRYWQKSAVFNGYEAVKIFSISLVVYVLSLLAFGFLLSLAFNTVERNFNLQTILLSTFSNFMNGFIYGSFFLAYSYYKKYKANQEQLAVYNHALSESKISQLKAQLNPHFLFNNLNVLDQLIEEDKHVASDFLSDFAEVYRYVLNASDKKLIALADELAFAEKYFGLMKHKYGDAYRLEIEHKNQAGYVVPLTIQLLLENAIQHNLGTVQKPVFIKIVMNENIQVLNNHVPKVRTKTTSGRALNNLKEQYALLTQLPVSIEQASDQFCVTIPVISNP